MQSVNALNIYQLNNFQTVIFMFKVKTNMASNIFNNNIKTIAHKYHTKYTIINFNEPLKNMNSYVSFSESDFILPFIKVLQMCYIVIKKLILSKLRFI